VRTERPFAFIQDLSASAQVMPPVGSFMPDELDEYHQSLLCISSSSSYLPGVCAPGQQ
jgi:hypothetical protein